MVTLALLCVVMTASPIAAFTAESDLVWILEDEVVSEDLYAAGNNIRISGRVEGDLVGVATDELVVEGVVTGSVFVVASRVEIVGVVEGSVRAAAGEVVITGRVGGDVVVGAGVLRVAGEVHRDILAAAWSVSARGKVGRDLRGRFRSVTLGGEINGDAQIRTEHLDVERGALVSGDLDYQASSLSGMEYLEEKVTGSVINRRVLAPNIRVRAFQLMTYIFLSLLMMAGGLIIVRLASLQVARAARRTIRSPLRNLGKGLLLFLSPLIGVLVVGMAAIWLPVYIWGPLLVGAVPLLIIVTGTWLLAALIAHVPVAVATGRAVGRVFHRDWELPLAYLPGVLVYVLALQIPVVGLPLVAIATILGGGAWLGRDRARSGADPNVQ